MIQPKKICMKEIRDHYETIGNLGQGTSGCVLAYRSKDTQQQYALKIIRSNSRHKHSDALNEIQIMKCLDHPRVIKIFKYYDETFFTYDRSERYETGLLIEKGIGSLQHCFRDQNYHYDFEDIIRFIVKFIELGAYLQAKQIVHRDIKPGNIIIFDKGLQFKLGDFGLSAFDRECPPGFAGTLAYCSPGLKKFYNSGNHRLYPQTNRYKDDVYSFAITSQQVVKRRYSIDDCPKEIKNLIDYMSVNDELNRPTFQHLMSHKTVQKYLSGKERLYLNQNQLKIIEIQKNKRLQDFTKKKMAEKDEAELNYTQKSKIVKYQQIYNNVCYGIRTICDISNEYILCGTQKGEIYALNLENQQVVKLNIHCNQYVAKIVLDRDRNVWIASGDGTVQQIQRQKLISYLKNNREIQISNKILFSKEKKASILVNLPKSQIKDIISQPKFKNISELICEDQYHFIIGYCSGDILLRWGEDEPTKHYCIHLDPITSLVVEDNNIYSCDFSGMVKVYSLSKKIIEKTIYKFNSELIGLSVNKERDGQNIEGITCKGQIKTINCLKSSNTTFDAEVPVKNIIGVSFGEKYFYLLTSDGQVYFRNHFLAKLEAQGRMVHNWVCIIQRHENQIILATREGQISILALQN